MSRITWSGTGTRSYQSGIDRGVLYVDDFPGVPWNGLTSIAEAPSGGTPLPFYVDGEKYLNLQTREEYSATLTAYTYPDEFNPCDGSVAIRQGLNITQQRRKPFSLSYRSQIGNDQSSSLGYKIHIVYNALAAPTNWTHKSLADTVAIDDFSWKLTTLAPPIGGYKRSPHLILDSTQLDPLVLSGLEDILYGNDIASARLPFLDEILDMIDTGNTLTVVDNGDGTYNIIAPMSALTILDDNTFDVTWPTVVPIDANTFTISSS